jgi:hypothetical protein
MRVLLYNRDNRVAVRRLSAAPGKGIFAPARCARRVNDTSPIIKGLLRRGKSPIRRVLAILGDEAIRETGVRRKQPQTFRRPYIRAMIFTNEQLHTACAADALSSRRALYLGHGYRSHSAVPVSFCQGESG